MFDASDKGADGGGSKMEKTLGDFAAEYAKSNRSTCKGCMEKIEKVRAWELRRPGCRDFLHWISLDVLREKKNGGFKCQLNTRG